MKILSLLLMLVFTVSSLFGCQRRQNLSAEEIPAIKAAIVSVEQAVRARDYTSFDSLLSSDAAKAGTDAQSVLTFIHADSLSEFVGFTQKEIVFRGDRARCDCFIEYSEGRTKPVTITLRKEDGKWHFKKIEPRTGEMFTEDEDSL